MPPTTTQVNSATLLMGVTGSGKSSLARTLAEYLWETWRKVLYYYACDGGGYPAKVQEGMALGIIKLWKMRTRDPGDLGLAFETCYRAAQGHWPRRINPATGETAPGVQMVAPIVKRLQMICPNGHVVKSVIMQQHLTPGPCPTCRVMVTNQTMQVQESLVDSKGFEDRGGVFFDGLSSMLSWEMMELGQRAGKLELKGEEAAIGGKVKSGDLSFGGTTRSHVGFAQTRGEELAHLSLGIPNLLVPPVFTALSMESSDEGALSIVGPVIAGRAKTDVAPQWFGNCLESAKRPSQVGTGEQFVLYLSEFTDQQGRRHLLKHRGAPGTMPSELADPPNDAAPFSEFNLGVFYRRLQAALEAGIAQAKQQYPDAPGVQDGVVEYGDGGQPQPAAAPQLPANVPQAPQAPQAPQVAAAAPGTPAAPMAPQAPQARVTAGKKKAAAPPVATPTVAPAVSPALPLEPQAIEVAATTPPEEMTAAPVTAVVAGAAALSSPAPVAATPMPQAMPQAHPAPAPAAAPAPAVMQPPALAPRPMGMAAPPGRPPAASAQPQQAQPPQGPPQPLRPPMPPGPPRAPQAPQAAKPPQARPATAPPTA